MQHRDVANEIALVPDCEFLFDAIALFDYLYLAAQDNRQPHVALPGFEQHTATLDGSAPCQWFKQRKLRARPDLLHPFRSSRGVEGRPLRYLFQVIVIVRQKLLACQCLFPVAEINRHSVFGKGFIWVAVQPAFAWLRGGDHRLSAGVRMFGGVLIRRTVAAQRYPTCLARSQMHPVVTDLHALFAFGAKRLLD